MGLCYKHKKWTEEDLEKVKELYLQKVPITHIAKRFRVTQGTIRKRLKEMGLLKSES